MKGRSKPVPAEELAERFRDLVTRLAKGSGSTDREALDLLCRNLLLPLPLRRFSKTASVLKTKVLQPTIYLLVLSGRVVYVGQTCSLLQRIFQHRDKGRKFDEVYCIEVERHEMNTVERSFISMFLEALNVDAGKTG